MQECKDAEPDVLFVGDSMVQLMQQFEVRHCFNFIVFVFHKTHFCHLIYAFSGLLLKYLKYCSGVASTGHSV